jgi:hypothetical protein
MTLARKYSSAPDNSVAMVRVWTQKFIDGPKKLFLNNHNDIATHNSFSLDLTCSDPNWLFNVPEISKVETMSHPFSNNSLFFEGCVFRQRNIASQRSCFEINKINNGNKFLIT